VGARTGAGARAARGRTGRWARTRARERCRGARARAGERRDTELGEACARARGDARRGSAEALLLRAATGRTGALFFSREQGRWRKSEFERLAKIQRPIVVGRTLLRKLHKTHPEIHFNTAGKRSPEAGGSDRRREEEKEEKLTCCPKKDRPSNWGRRIRANRSWRRKKSQGNRRSVEGNPRRRRRGNGEGASADSVLNQNSAQTGLYIRSWV